jgi:shikimate dehydrogenase
MSSVSIDAQTRIATLIGHPVEHSLSPLIHNTAFRAQGVNAVYVATPVRPEAVGDAVEGLRALHFLGANVTIPHKQAVMPFLDAVSAQARAVGAVNTIVCDDAEGRPTLRGDNTDVEGFLAPLETRADALNGAEMTVLGAGGAARAVVYGLLDRFQPSRLHLAARRPEQAEHLAGDLAEHDEASALHPAALGDAGAGIRASRLVVNATPVGMEPNDTATPWPEANDFGEGQVVYDLVYSPRETRLLCEAADRGADVVGGLAMLIGQAAAAYRQWTGRDMPVEAVRDAILR